jgi:hypothetical protein
VIAAQLKQAGDIIPLMAQGLPADSGSKEEYRRIPWIWRVAIAAGKSGDTDTIRSILIASLPAEGQRLEHWQSVVIGGGLINGISLSGPWPSEELTKIVGEDASLKTAWHRSLELATAMADDESVPTGTRYDALRMVALRDWAIAGPQLLRYLQKGVHNELQMGSISGLADVRQPEVAGHLINGYQHFSAHNRELVIKALIRSEDRCLALLQALADGKLAADVKQHASVRKLTEHESEAVRQAAQNVLK